ncbi:copper-binding protein [Lactobacillus apis]|uniref:cupredoxin domain-containing protein n=1 Tax=Lactobacillus apis TaxID=303541 RepID=UPI000D6CEA66|nr:cupredoxin domain-containing protein [Lactobacillus apis]AWM73508.1 copper-binding protein [Lactobacillus apis]
MKVITLIVGIMAIAFIAWWFLGKHDASVEQAKVNSTNQTVNIQVKGGYSPEKVVLKKGVPATLNFKRLDSSSCLDHVIFSDLGINQELPKGQVEQVKIDTSKAGEYDWGCSMNMFHGKVIVK